MSQSTRPLLIVVGGTDRVYRGYCVKQAAAAYPIALIDTKPPSWQQHLVVDHEVADTYDPEAVVAAGLALATRHPIAGVVTWDEYTLVPTAELAARLGVPGNSAAAMTACRDKATSRRLFAEHSVPSATSTRVGTLAEATVAALRTGFPVVLKPSSHAASIGVVRVDTPEGLPAAWEFAAAGAGEQGPEGSGVLVEEYLSGPEISVECVTQHGVTTALAVTRKEVAFPPYFEEVGHTVDAGDPLLLEVAPPSPSRPSRHWASPTASSTWRCDSPRPARGSLRSTPGSAAT
ncbi:ATP-grasp domain-containing protein [Streptomyces monashensis]|uniref:ATP-grasp domain-containing protein n=1 Tax=Streptomyces monashensis TaxID=1678012 RepID=UPI000A86DDC9